MRSALKLVAVGLGLGVVVTGVFAGWLLTGQRLAHEEVVAGLEVRTHAASLRAEREALALGRTQDLLALTRAGLAATRASNELSAHDFGDARQALSEAHALLSSIVAMPAGAELVGELVDGVVLQVSEDVSVPVQRLDLAVSQIRTAAAAACPDATEPCRGGSR